MSKIIHKKSSVVDKIPAAGDLEYGELALNYADGIIYYKKADNSIQTISSGGGNGVVTANKRAYTVTTVGSNTYSLQYILGSVSAFVNGVKLRDADITATDNLTVTLPDLLVGDEVELLGFTSFGYGTSGSTYNRKAYTATAGQVIFAVAYSTTATASYVEVFINGILIDATEYTATNGVNVTLVTAAKVGDVVECIGLKDFQLIDIKASGTGLSYDVASSTVILNSSTTAVADTIALRDGSGNLTASNVVTNANLTGAITSVGNATSLGSFTAAQLATAVVGETGTGNLVFATSPALSGTPTAPTAGVGVSTTQIATTAYVQREVLADIAALGPAFKNRIINGDMRIDQRSNGALVSGIAAGANLLPDRFTTYAGGVNSYSLQQVTDAPVGFVNSLKLTVTAAATLSAAQFAFTRQIIEGINIADFAWGSASATSVTVSFWVKSSLTGLFAIALINSAEDRSYPATYNINSVNTWEYKTILVPGDTTGIWLTNNSNGIRLAFDHGAGSNFNGTANTWQSGWKQRTSGCVSLSQTLGATFQLTGLQLEKGSTATSFDYRDYGRELIMCQRYYQAALIPSQSLGVYLTPAARFVLSTISLPVVMRTNATTLVSTFGRWADGGTTYSADSSVGWFANASTTIIGIQNNRQAGGASNPPNGSSFWWEGIISYTASAEL